jgi:alkylation response protein AidB-like acyl-CoA dehydrogenase
MGHYKSNLRDLEFALFEVFGVDGRLGQAPFAELDGETARGILAEVERLASGPLAESLVDTDRNPPVFDPATHGVTLPESFKKSFRAYMDAEWWRMALPEELGGIVVPPSLQWAAAELILGANPAVFMYATGPNMAHVLYRLGTPDQRTLAQLMVDRRWSSTMVLTEPDAGSDVGAGRTVARQQADGSWQLEGVKRFITSGEHDLAENIIHFVLARPEGHGPGTKGLSMFIVPKYLFDLENGELGERNGVLATNLEHKMGLKASTTCELRLGEDRAHPAVGYLVGEVHDGIRQMFKIIEYARMMVGTKAIATLSTGYLNALDYAKTRVQGADLTQITDKAAPRVTITHHPDVRRMLMLQKAYAEGMRALVLYTATQQDAVAVALARGNHDEAAEKLNDLLLPIVKGVGSERSYELLALSLQTLGGSGYLQDYPIEQYIRDSKIDTLYEGTTSIQGQDLFFRKIVRDQGGALTGLLTEIGVFVEGEDGNGRLKEERGLLGTALADVQAMVGAMVGFLTSSGEDIRNIYKVGQNTTRLLMSLGDLVIGWLLLREAAVATAALDSGTASAQDRAFYEGKVAAARFFATTVLPELTARRLVTQRTDNALMDLPEASF